MKKASKIAMAKRTRLGRVLCRLFGDEAGQGMMEYVVLALLVCAAVVGIVMVFGDSISNMFFGVTSTLNGEAGVDAAAQARTSQIQANTTALGTQRTNSDAIRKGQAAQQ